MEGGHRILYKDHLLDPARVQLWLLRDACTWLEDGAVVAFQSVVLKWARVEMLQLKTS